MKHHQTMSTLALVCLFALIVLGCEAKDPSKNSPTSGNLILYVDEAYENLIRPLADSFTTNHAPDMNIEIRTVQARDAVEELINLHIAHLADTSTVDTAAAVAIIIGRSLLEDEKKVIADRHLEKGLMDIPLAWDGLAIVVPNDSPLQETTVERLKESLTKENRTLSSLQETKGSNAPRFIFPSANSSSYAYVRNRLLNGGEPATPARWVETTDSVLDQIANGEGIGLMAWYPAHLDSLRLRTLRVGYTDSTGAVQPPTRIHPASLVMNKYPMKLRIVGYSFSGIKSPANGFLSWLARSDVAQHEMGKIGLEPENVHFVFTTEE
ncbi:MAG: substrate-binding domain-containing protein [Ignavibacteriae bacterium]|nr:substrate-binding domain-containing protein [Ignavibacteriota bacterium]MCB9214759.1 substrate-binding domain-containing protein [Ignavibacteria bacterium]